MVRTDNLSQEQRSYCMSKIRSKWTFYEIKLHNYLKSKKIKYKIHPKTNGSPDIILIDKNIAVFIQGCFWHKCPKCYKESKSNKEYWVPKIEKNVKRDQKNEKIIKSSGFKIIKVWEHQFKNDFQSILNKIIND